MWQRVRESRIIPSMQPVRTVIETPTFQGQADEVWDEDERLGFIAWIAAHPLDGDVIPGSGGARKVRWGVKGRGKRGGVRIIYYDYAADGTLTLVMMYAKNERENVSPKTIEKAK